MKRTNVDLDRREYIVSTRIRYTYSEHELNRPPNDSIDSQLSLSLSLTLSHSLSPSRAPAVEAKLRRHGVSVIALFYRNVTVQENIVK